MRARPATTLSALLLPALLLTACTSGTSGSSADHAPAGALGTSPLQNPDGTRPGLAPLTTAADHKAGRDLIGKVRTAAAGPRTGYDRDQFGPAWTDNVDGTALGHNNCDTRNDLLARDGRSVQHKDGSACTVTSMTIHDPYTGKDVQWTKAQATRIQIDHVMPLSYDWQMGAAKWDKAKRVRIANDPLNLIPADGPQNSAKGDSGPSEWLPADPKIRCAYVVRFAQVALKYDLPVTPADKQTMLAQCS
ncbi:HNH endonuclease family protein [Kitasatospora sp. DSM 101779]|uniref:HNH endonuclease family protein n=1 Tax=Kitasatospora sp. DSM 101779 TaxID=2853165 RepID=UPI0021D8E21A|nr:HNH endonuclease family protein [Kitasatospora sp. DSM 101779]MCU7825480.1 HNH endonuclease family protein [Kitasatospora sp. DSM 101779]